MITLLTEDEYHVALARAETLMSDPAQKLGGELDKLADQIVAYEALDEATLALIASMRVYTATRRDKRLEATYRTRAEVVVRAWLDAIAAQTKRSATAPADEDKA